MLSYIINYQSNFYFLYVSLLEKDHHNNWWISRLRKSDYDMREYGKTDAGKVMIIQLLILIGIFMYIC